MPLVIDATDILLNPKKALRIWCEQLAIPFDTEMLHWPSGSRETDGVWAKYWYNSVINSTKFRSYSSIDVPLSHNLRKTLSICMPYHQELSQYKLSISE